jgi:N-acyl-L-homoserine lactone synthetase
MASDVDGFVEAGLRVSWALTHAEILEAQALRAEVFCRELQWVGSSSDAIERDSFDDHCTVIAVLGPDSEVVATVRLVPAERPWMFDEVFRELLPDPAALHRTNSVEASRLAVARPARRLRLSGGRTVADLLFKATYLFCRERGVRWVYMLTSDAVGRRFTTAGLPCAPIAAPTRMPDGVVAVPLVLDWDGLRPDAPLRAWFDVLGGRQRTPPTLDGGRGRPQVPFVPAAGQSLREIRGSACR